MDSIRRGLSVLALLTLSPSLSAQPPLSPVRWAEWPVTSGYRASDHTAVAIPTGGIVVQGGFDVVGIEIVGLSLCSIEPIMAGGMMMDFCVDITPPTGPSARVGHAAAYDPIRNCIVSYGGINSGGVNGETWEYSLDTLNWTQRFPMTNPLPVHEAAMAFDPDRGMVILTGGAKDAIFSDFTNQALAWDGTNWHPIVTADSPPAVSDHQLVYCPDMGMVQFAGADLVPNNETWVLGPNNWTRLNTPHSPPAVFAHGMAYDAARECLVTFGGVDDQFNAVNWTWELSNGDWIDVTPTHSPSPRFSHTLTYDSVTGCMVAIGGASPLDVFENPWTLASTSPATFVPFGVGCPGAFGVPTINVAPGGFPWIGDDLVVDLGNLPPGSPPAFVAIGLSSTTWAGFSLPADLGPLGAPGCTVFTSVDVAVPTPTAGGIGQLSIPIPNDLSLDGLQIFNQGVVLEPGVNPGGIIVTGAAVLTLGRRY